MRWNETLRTLGTGLVLATAMVGLGCNGTADEGNVVPEKAPADTQPNTPGTQPPGTEEGNVTANPPAENVIAPSDRAPE